MNCFSSHLLLGKNKRIKDAQNEAKAEIEQFKAERERRYKNLEQQVKWIEEIQKFLFRIIEWFLVDG